MASIRKSKPFIVRKVTASTRTSSYVPIAPSFQTRQTRRDFASFAGTTNRMRIQTKMMIRTLTLRRPKKAMTSPKS